MEPNFAILESLEAGDFSLLEEQLTELTEMQAMNDLPVGEEKERSDVPLVHNYAFSAKKDPLLSASTRGAENYDPEKDLFKNDINTQTIVDDEWVNQFLNHTVKEKDDSVNCLPPTSGPAQQSPSSSSTEKPAESSVEIVHIGSDNNPPDSTMSTNSKKSRKRKASGNSTVSDSSETVLDRNTKNAIAARENRLKKKIYVEGLEKKNQELEKENKVMQDEMKQQEDRISRLEREVEYLKNVLHNQSALSSLLGNLKGNTNVRLSIAGHGGKRRRDGGSKEVIPMSKGVCLHVDGQTASLEFCSLCAVKAKGGSL